MVEPIIYNVLYILPSTVGAGFSRIFKPSFPPKKIVFVHLAGKINTNYSFSHNHGSGKWLYLKGNYYWRDPFLTSMTMRGSVVICLLSVVPAFHHHLVYAFLKSILPEAFHKM